MRASGYGSLSYGIWGFENEIQCAGGFYGLDEKLIPS